MHVRIVALLGITAAFAIATVALAPGAAAPPSGEPAPFVSAPPGFHVTVVSKHVPGARFMAFAPNGDLLVAQTAAGNIVVIHPGTSPDAVPERFDTGLSLPHGMTFVNDRLYVATWSGVRRYQYPNAHATIIFDNMPQGGVHNRRALAIAADGTIYVSSGSTCNVCEEDDARFATILRYNPGDTHGVIYAHGLRNASGLAFDPSGRLWAVVNQRDNIGPTQAVTDNLPPDELDLIVQGADYGWPRCYPDPGARRRLPNPEYPKADCAATRPASFDIPPHSAPLGVVFYQAHAFPKSYQGAAFIAFHGSWNRSTPAGDKVVAVSFAGGRPVALHDFVTGWITPDNTYRNRPVGLAVGPDGALYISDDLQGYIYRVAYAP
ncbi:MAG: PQQ-dependent sugar dehydrogenase [Candidatus Eremiobacteraeota bacterium]|nr:PQQ-dependent sugar dehydrogenase [Candidatus Eremiobacteraeota bacterium]